uniref:Amidase domain-containing protein n=1 Tax=Echinococcus granulosus TaxID=6210 RepID=A0A068X2U3_ECHGR|nr:hypothetical protein EgrG_002061700 [Echinococcus granulosus]
MEGVYAGPVGQVGRANGLMDKVLVSGAEEWGSSPTQDDWPAAFSNAVMRSGWEAGVVDAFVIPQYHTVVHVVLALRRQGSRARRL